MPPSERISTAYVQVSPDQAEGIVAWGRMRTVDGRTLLASVSFEERWRAHELAPAGVVELGRVPAVEAPVVLGRGRSHLARWACSHCDRLEWEQMGPLELVLRGAEAGGSPASRGRDRVGLGAFALAVDAGRPGSRRGRAGDDAAAAPAGCAELKGKLEEFERAQILEALSKTGGNQTRAAKLLGIARRTLIKKMVRHGIERPRAAAGRSAPENDTRH